MRRDEVSVNICLISGIKFIFIIISIMADLGMFEWNLPFASHVSLDIFC